MSDKYQDALLKFKNFFKITIYDNDFGNKIFETLRTIIDFDSAYIYYINPETLKYSYNTGTKAASELSAPLKINDAEFGKIVVTSKIAEKYTIDDKTIFETCAALIANLIREVELSQIINLQIKALQDGIAEKNKEYKKVLASDKLKNDFIANVSHELRTPLNSIIGFSDSLLDGIFGSLNEKQREYLTDIKIAGLHLLEMVNDILDISKIEAGAMKFNPTKFSADLAVNEVVNIIKPLADKKDIIIETNTNDEEIIADYQKIQQILFNLLSNAVKFTPEYGKVTITTEKAGEKFKLIVKDTGIGIAKKDHKKIFKKFEQVQNSNIKNENSTGLGLTITKEFVKMHSGEILLQSEKGHGAIFTVIIPQNKD